ncbi:glycosyltransferase [Pontibacter sp. H249]|uniref:glycosyltransferase n=1 Tax=Pontibacter sp. H249 TaxID=3133420 RepID=UPI0030C27B35
MVTEVSILIPVFNQDVTAMVYTLLAQCKRLAIRYEILLYDDGSEEGIKIINRPLAKQEGVVYFELPQNIGRAAIRNKLAANAKYSHLLMMDNDCLPVSPNFVKNYLDAAHKSDVIIGGMIYADVPPPAQYRLRWKYGQKREALCYSKRNKDPYKSFFLKNVFIKKEVLHAHPVPEVVTKYGHEDTLLGLILQKNGIRVLHLYNPVMHTQLETNEHYIKQTSEAIQMLKVLNQHYPMHNINLVKCAFLLKRMRVANLFTLTFGASEKHVLKALTAGYGSVLLFDLYRLYLFCKLN